LRRFRPALLGVLLPWLLLPQSALAHAAVVALDPPPGSVQAQPPTVVRITFSEPVTPFGRGIDVYSSSGRRVSGTAVASGFALVDSLNELGPGTYLVEWRVVARDTHPSRGSYTFSVGHPGPIPGGLAPASDLGSVAPAGLLLQAVSRWLHFLGFALAFGTVAFQLLVLRETEAATRLRRLAYAGIVLLVAAEPIALVAQAASLGTIDSASLADVLGSAFGRVLALRLGAALLLWGLFGAVRQARGRGAWAILALGAALAAVDGLAGHTIAGLPQAAAYLLTALHVAAMAAWLGGFAGLLATVGGTRDKRALVARFGPYAGVSIAVLLLTGALLALVHLRGPSDLLFSAYGLTLAIKLAAVAVVLRAAWLGLRRLRSGRPEAVALAGVLALAALLSSLPPPR
jgi:copper transport protein